MYINTSSLLMSVSFVVDFFLFSPNNTSFKEEEQSRPSENYAKSRAMIFPEKILDIEIVTKKREK